MKRKTIHRISTIFIIFMTFSFGVNPAVAKKKSDETKIRNHIERWSEHCKRQAAEDYQAASSDIRVSVGASERQAIDSGDLTWDEIRRYGLSFNWEVHQRDGKADGYCTINGEGKIVDFVTNHEEYRDRHSSGSGDDSRIQASIGRWGNNCKNRVADQYDAPMSDIQVSVGSSMQQSIDAGDLTWDEVRRYGLSFNWKVDQRDGKADGYCNVNGDGDIVDFVANREEYRDRYSSGSGDDAKIQARVGRWGNNCKNRVAEQFDVPMSDIRVSVGNTMQQSIDAGDITLNDIEQYGLSFNWEVNSQYKSASGYCNTDGDGNVVEFRQ